MSYAEDPISSLAAGGLLMDVDKTRLPHALLQHPGSLAPVEAETLQSHAAYGQEIVNNSGINDQDLPDIVRTHHARHDGSGYPAGLIGNAIPITGRMLSIIDSYDAMVRIPPYRTAVSRHQALRQIYSARDTLLRLERVERFQTCLGVYPTGSLVELSTGEVAVVMAQNQVRRLRPQVMILSTQTKQPLNDFRQLDLMNQVKRSPAVDIVCGRVASDCSFDATELFLQQ